MIGVCVCTRPSVWCWWQCWGRMDRLHGFSCPFGSAESVLCLPVQEVRSLESSTEFPTFASVTALLHSAVQGCTEQAVMASAVQELTLKEQENMFFLCLLLLLFFFSRLFSFGRMSGMETYKSNWIPLPITTKLMVP